MKLTFDLPTEYNDMSQSEVARLAVQVKTLVDDLTYILSHIDENNLAPSLKEKINSAYEKEGEVNVFTVDSIREQHTDI